MLVELENSGLIKSRTVSRGRYGYGREYRLEMPLEIVGPATSKDWWNKILAEKQGKEEKERLIRVLDKIGSGINRRRWHMHRLLSYNV